MARIAGVDLPRDKRVEYALPYIYGIGLTLSREILEKTGINPDTRVRDLTEAEIAKLRELLDHEYKVEGDLRREESLNTLRQIRRILMQHLNSSTGSACSWSEHQEQRPYSQRPQERWRQEEIIVRRDQTSGW